VTESISGFLFPENAAIEQRRAIEQQAQLDDVARLVVTALASAGPTPLPTLIEAVDQRPRAVMLTIDQLEQAGLIKIEVHGVEEVADLTEAGRRKADT
jgi:hypothetical protein